MRGAKKILATPFVKKPGPISEGAPVKRIIFNLWMFEDGSKASGCWCCLLYREGRHFCSHTVKTILKTMLRREAPSLFIFFLPNPFLDPLYISILLYKKDSMQKPIPSFKGFFFLTVSGKRRVWTLGRHNTSSSPSHSIHIATRLMLPLCSVY